MKRYCLLVAVMVVFIPFVAKSQKPATTSSDFKLTKPNGQPMATLININNLSMWVRADGWSGRNPITRSAGTIFPWGTTNVIFQDGIIWGGIVEDGLRPGPKLRVGGQKFSTGTVPGRIISKGVAEDPNAPDVRIWRIRRDYQTADLTQDAAELNNNPVDEVTEAQIQAVRQQYEKDWNEWPWEKGAPFYNNNDNGVMDPCEAPGLANADQVVWFVANDLDEGSTFSAWESPRIGIEMQVTLWAYNRQNAFDNIIFKRYRLIYKGHEATPDTSRIDSMFIGQWSDSDIGDVQDDFAGCDSTLQVAYGYNSTTLDSEFHELNLPPPSVGYVLLQGPIVPDPNGDARFDFKTKRGFRNLKMSSFVYAYPGLQKPDFIPETRIRRKTFNNLNGFLPLVELKPYVDPEGNATKFPLNGDPINGRGWIDGVLQPPGDRRIMINAGPFTMALGDTQEVIVALVAGLGADRLFSVQVMKHHAKWARQLALANFELPPEPQPQEPSLPKHFRLSQNFPNPFNPGTEIHYELPVERHVNLTVYNVLGQRIKTLVDEVKEAGSYSVTWDGTDERGQPVPSGVYFYRFDAGVVSGTKKMLLMR
ncbi:T9SS type A sorting domain-containing protein [candidate division KSB1 bacterium]|nr:T9SS type A sorting domain-containing protein [candidate division KSB1 bacterium]NIR70513.1 T9SS type A sorting domain-containing protein [candidate division KSB1 bacterium]NIS24512.1 T9SS type A sorting domain-containing protein [candidate division KSB1 bacterium]NIT70107.1 T9SS type A sorting domain-containing protein [candidate division KSB1 bacterium]NIU23762.1 T9SS type A sorting domain-containing protein [candidate division KSB1 bacterium]